MTTVTDVVLAQTLLGRPSKHANATNFGLMADSGFHGPIPSSSPDNTQLNATRTALVNALMDSGPTTDPYGLDTAPRAISPTKTDTSSRLNQWGRREYDVYDPPPLPPLPFNRQYRRDAPPPADSSGRLTHDPEGRPLGARHVVGLTEVDGLNVGLRQEEIADVIRRLVGQDPIRLPGIQMGNSYGRTHFDPPPLKVEIRGNLRPDLRRKVEAHELSHVIDIIAKFIPVEPHRKQLSAIYNTLNNPWRTRDGLDAAPGRPFVPLQRSPAYTGWQGDRELMAEAIRAYLVDPNYIKTVAPELASAIRDAVNSNPILAPTIQFNNLRLPTHAELAPSLGQLKAGTT